MSRVVDYDNLSEDDLYYLACRGELPTDVMSVADQRDLVQLDPAFQPQLANTGTANTAALTDEQLEEELERRRSAVVEDPRELFGKEGVAGALADEDEDDALEPPYDQYNKGQLSAELQRRNEEDDGERSLSGNKDELVARLVEDDAAE